MSAEIGSGKRSSVDWVQMNRPPSGSPVDSVVRAGAADLEAAQVVAAQEEAVDDLLLLPLVEQVAGARRQRDAPVAVPGEPVERNEILAVDVGADEVRIAAETGKICAERDEIAGMRIDLAVPMIEA